MTAQGIDRLLVRRRIRGPDRRSDQHAGLGATPPDRAASRPVACCHHRCSQLRQGSFQRISSPPAALRPAWRTALARGESTCRSPEPHGARQAWAHMTRSVRQAVNHDRLLRAVRSASLAGASTSARQRPAQALREHTVAALPWPAPPHPRHRRSAADVHRANAVGQAFPVITAVEYPQGQLTGLIPSLREHGFSPADRPWWPFGIGSRWRAAFL